MPLPSRLFPVTKIIFDAINQAGTKGIIVGGAAAYMLGSKRATKDVDINVLSFPEFPEGPKIQARFPFEDDKSIMKVTYLDPVEAVKADVATRRAQHIPLFLKYSMTDPETNFQYANYQLLLADKIQTFAERGEKIDKKRETDLFDIKFCIEEMYAREEKMPEELKFLYSAEDWSKVLTCLKEEVDHEHYMEMLESLDIV